MYAIEDNKYLLKFKSKEDINLFIKHKEVKLLTEKEAKKLEDMWIKKDKWYNIRVATNEGLINYSWLILFDLID